MPIECFLRGEEAVREGTPGHPEPLIASSTVGHPGFEPLGLKGLEALASLFITLAASLGPSLRCLCLLPLRLACLPVLPSLRVLLTPRFKLLAHSLVSSR